LQARRIGDQESSNGTEETSPMTHVVTEVCIGCRYTDCVEVCPVDCFHQGPNFLSIDPDECIDCAKCIPECPITAIVADVDLSSDQQHMLPLNAELSQIHPVISRSLERLPDADEWKGKTDKLQFLQR
jgi:ferredoxin